jgi:hypothetical protein
LSGFINSGLSGLGFSASIAPIGNHFTGGQVAASGADPDIELFLFHNFMFSKLGFGFSWDPPDFYIWHYAYNICIYQAYFTDRESNNFRENDRKQHRPH